MMNEEIKRFIEGNINLIEQNKWEEIYEKDFPIGFTETLLKCGINPLEYGLNYIPDSFLGESNVEEFIIPNSVTRIEAYAFFNCSSLQNIEIPNSVTSIGEDAFYNCNSLINVIIGDNVWSIENEAFRDCLNLKNIEIPNSIKVIGKKAFSNCSNLKKIIFKGTKEEAITCGVGDKLFKNWRQGSAIKKIICTDGEIIL